MRFSYESVQNMPVWERRIYLDLWQRELEEQKKERQAGGIYEFISSPQQFFDLYDSIVK